MKSFRRARRGTNDHAFEAAFEPPFGHARQPALRAQRARIAFLIPAAVGTNYWARHIDRKAMVYFLSPRLTFVGHAQSYPKDLALCLYGDPPRYECWRWKP